MPALDGELAAHLLRELLGPGSERCSAWRGSQRWVAGYAPVRLEAGEGGRSRLAAIAGRGACLVTGGLGGIGLALAGLWARETRAPLVLTGRSGLPDRGAFDAWLAEHGPADATSRRIRAVRALEEQGSEVLVCAADAADEGAMRAALDAARARFGRVAGVIHAAGLPGAGLLSLKTLDEARAVLAPKVRGTQVLERLLDGEPLEFVALCSSLATAVTAVGQVDYFAANAYLDAWAAAQRARHPERLTVSIGWDAWSEAGMALETTVPDALREGREQALRLGLTHEEGCAAFLRILAADFPQVLVSTRDLEQRIREHEAELAVADAKAAAPAPPGPKAAYERPALATAYRAPETPSEARVAEVWADLLGIERIGADDSFFELGGNSLLLMQLSVRLRGSFGISLPIKALFDASTVRAQAERLDGLRAVAAPSAAPRPGEETEELAL
jgi:NAD(P)-dependent dehydrogenase (short-subunit alcohol dehydrogenase family)/acyl carrier protein